MTPSRFALTAVISCTCLASAAAAQARPHPDCGAVQGQQPMNACFAEEARRSMALLDTLIRELRDSLPKAQATQLIVVQGAWLKYRDAQCKWEAAFADGGSIQPMVAANCLERLTWSRIDDLKMDLCEGWGQTGPCPASERFDREPRE